ncbi:MAG: DUF1638 domain-containing protein [Bacillota bacterium]
MSATPKRYLIIACHVLWRELCHLAAFSENTFDFVFLNQGLHDTPDQLRIELQAAIDAADVSPQGEQGAEGAEANCKYEAILIGYGLCSNGIEGIVARNTQLVVPRGHDCITFFLGSKERYKEYFDANPGTYWYTPGWIDDTVQPSRERYESSLAIYTERYGEDNAEYLMEMESNWFKEYKKAAFIDYDFMNFERYKEYTKECAEYLNWEYDELKGDMTLLQAFLAGPKHWSEDKFLIIAPGEVIAASHDERIVCKG